MNRRVEVRRDLFAILEGVVYPMGWSVTCPCCAGRPMFTASNWKSAMANAIIHAEAHASEHAEEHREFASILLELSNRKTEPELDLRLIFVMTRPEDVLRDAFGAVVRDVQEGAGESPAVVYGRP